MTIKNKIIIKYKNNLKNFYKPNLLKIILFLSILFALAILLFYSIPYFNICHHRYDQLECMPNGFSEKVIYYIFELPFAFIYYYMVWEFHVSELLVLLFYFFYIYTLSSFVLYIASKINFLVEKVCKKYSTNEK